MKKIPKRKKKKLNLSIENGKKFQKERKKNQD